MYKARLHQVRLALQHQGFDGFVLPRSDEFQNEYLAPYAERLAWLTGFTGSAGLAIVLPHEAIVFSDGRYALQLQQELDPTIFQAGHTGKQSPRQWLKEALRPGMRIGFDPWLHTPQDAGRWQKVVEAAGGFWVPCAPNIVDQLWIDQPALPSRPFVLHPLVYAGQEVAEKIAMVQRVVQDHEASAMVITAVDAVAWCLNIRGRDIPYTPVGLAWAWVHADGGVDLMVRGDVEAAAQVREHLGERVKVYAWKDYLEYHLRQWAGQTVLVDEATAVAALYQHLQRAGAKVRGIEDPCLWPKACKNTVEIAGARQAHVLDGIAVTRFLGWLDNQIISGAVVSEVACMERLQFYRSQSEDFLEPSFETIAGFNAHGAIIHYRATAATEALIEKDGILLIDSGGQYFQGTTDITRTLAIGVPTDEQRQRYTQVLKGHIALATARFPEGTTGAQLDTLARQFLWQSGRDYDHGTGHGVGSCLSVHEGPGRISRVSNVPLKAGMILSNEPGYYRPEHFGMRLENLVLVVESLQPGDEQPMLAFETLTLAPFDPQLLYNPWLTPDEISWLKQYHELIWQKLEPSLSAQEKSWLKAIVDRF
jgi:Xaa-Pro aminopeptidase